MTIFPVSFALLWSLVSLQVPKVFPQKLSGLDLTIPIAGASERCQHALNCTVRCPVLLGTASETYVLRMVLDTVETAPC